MTPFEREVIDRLGRIETKLDADYRALHGNGHPGLIDKHSDLEQRVRILETSQTPTNGELQDRIQSVEDRHRSNDKKGSAAVTWIALLLNAAGTVYAIFRNTN